MRVLLRRYPNAGIIYFLAYRNYNQRFRLKKININKPANPIMPITNQKSNGPPIKGRYEVFMPNMEAISERGKVIKAIMVSTFITSFCFVESRELFVSRNS